MQWNECSSTAATDFKYDRRDQGPDTKPVDIRPAGGVSGLPDEFKKIKVVIWEIYRCWKDTCRAVPRRGLCYYGNIQR